MAFNFVAENFSIANNMSDKILKIIKITSLGTLNSDKL